MGAFKVHAYCFLWDLVDEGIDQVLDRLAGEAGVTGVTVATQYPRVDQLRPHAGISPRRFRSDGGAQFQFNNDKYLSTRMRPVTADWLRKRNPLGKVAEACQKRGLRFRASNVCCRNPASVAKYPEHAVKDIFGQIDPNWLCPANLDVRELLRCMIEDLTDQFGFDAVELVAASFPMLGIEDGPAQIGFKLGRIERFLYNLCFCESCRQMAERDGVDVVNVAVCVKKHLEKTFETGRPIEGSLADFIAGEPALETFVDWRCRQVTSLLQLIAQACQCNFVVQHAGDRFTTGTDLAAIASHCDALIPFFDGADPADLADLVQSVHSQAAGKPNIELALSVCSPPCEDSASLVACMKRAVELGIRFVNVANYGLIPLARLEWIHKAARYAAREAV